MLRSSYQPAARAFDTALHHAPRTTLRRQIASTADYRRTLANTARQLAEGKLSATSHGQFVLQLPLKALSPHHEGDAGTMQMQLHPQQTLSLVSAMIRSETADELGKEAAGRRVTFHSKDGNHRWASSTELSDFVRDAAQQAGVFTIRIAREDDRGKKVDLSITVPSWDQRSSFLRSELKQVSHEIKRLLDIKERCDAEAERVTKRFAVFGFVALCGWWALVYGLTFHSPYGWDLMEPVTYLFGLSGVMIAYLLALYCARAAGSR